MNSYDNIYMKRSRKAAYIIYLLALIMISGTLSVFAQDNAGITQVIRGTIVDAASKEPLTGATIQVMGSDPILGTVTDFDGNFTLRNVPVGRVVLGVSYLGFESKTIPNVIVNSGKETVLTIELTEAIIKGDEVTVSAYKQNGLPTNEMAIVGARSVSVEEINRLTASFNDPAFITANFAGVRNSGTGGNDIIIRGNSPKYMQWRLEGVPITNPNHFADQNLVMGSTSTLNANLLATSDFYTGAFPAEYGNAVSGVYDIKLRNGNSEKYEGIIGFGLIGTDFTLEGPIKKGSGSSFLVNYRNSTSSVLTDMGLVEVAGDPRFQDAAFKLTVPTKNAGIFSAFGLGGYSDFALKDVTPFDWDSPGSSGMREDVTEDFDKASLLFNTGLNHFISLGGKGYLNTSVSYSVENLEEDVLQHLANTNTDQESFNSEMNRASVRFATEYTRKINARSSIAAGTNYTIMIQKFDQELRETPESDLQTLLDFDENIGNWRNFISLKHRLSESFTVTAGIQNNNVFFNEQYTIEPRLAAKWQFNEKNALNLGYGLHSTLENLHHYFANIEQPDGSTTQPNKDLGLMKAHHFVAGVDHYFNPNLLGKIEVYYQHLYDVPVENDPNSYFSTINEGAEIEYFELVNDGTAENYGVELTLQKFFSDNYYFLLNTSVYESKYTAMDGKERNTKFNGNYVANAIFGKEFVNLGKKNNQTLALNIRAFVGGGQKIIPLLRDSEGNLAVDPANNNYLDYSKAYERDLEDLYMITLSGSYKFERARTSHEIFLNLENITNNKGKLTEYYDAGKADKVNYTTMFGLLPNLMYRVYL